MKARRALTASVFAVFLTIPAVRGCHPRSLPRPIHLLLEAERSWLARPVPGATVVTTGPVTGVMTYEPAHQRQFPETDLLQRVLHGLRALDN